MPGATAPGSAVDLGPVPGGLPGGDALNSGTAASATPAPEVVGAQSTPSANKAMEDPSANKAMEDAAQAASALQEQWKAIVAFAQPYVQTYVASLRPWRSFCVCKRPEPGSSLHARIEENLVHFQANYMVIAAFSLGVFLISHPAHCIAGIITGAAWAIYVQKGGLDP